MEQAWKMVRDEVDQGIKKLNERLDTLGEQDADERTNLIALLEKFHDKRTIGHLKQLHSFAVHHEHLSHAYRSAELLFANALNLLNHIEMM